MATMEDAGRRCLGRASGGDHSMPLLCWSKRLRVRTT